MTIFCTSNLLRPSIRLLTGFCNYIHLQSVHILRDFLLQNIYLILCVYFTPACQSFLYFNAIILARKIQLGDNHVKRKNDRDISKFCIILWSDKSCFYLNDYSIYYICTIILSLRCVSKMLFWLGEVKYERTCFPQAASSHSTCTTYSRLGFPHILIPCPWYYCVRIPRILDFL